MDNSQIIKAEKNTNIKVNSREKFKIIIFIKDLIFILDTYLINFPKKEIELKKKIMEKAYDLLDLASYANVTKDPRKRLELQENCVANLKVIDILLNLCYDKHIINNKQYLKFGERLDTLLRYFAGWINMSQRQLASTTSANGDGDF